MGNQVVVGNLNSMTPAAPSGSVNGIWQSVGDDASVYLSPFVASGASHAPGLVPDPGATAGTTKFLREDGTWDVPSSGGGGGAPAMNGNKHFVQYNNSTTIDYHNSAPANSSGSFWSQFQGTFLSWTNYSNGGNPANWKMIASGSPTYASLAEDGINTEGCWNIFEGYSAYFSVDTPSISGQIVWACMSSQLYGSMNAVNPNTTVWGFRYAQGTDTNYQAYVSTSNTAFTAVDTGVAVDGNFHQTACFKNSTGGLDFYIDGAKVATIASTATGFPSGTTGVYGMLVINCSTSAALHINHVTWWSY